MTNERTFDASRYLSKLKGKDYLEVKWRLLWLRTEHPDAEVKVLCLSHDAAAGWASFRASVAIPNAGSADGHGMEERKDFNDYYEKAETKALGRALAALGYGTQFTEDFDFTDGKADRVVDAAVSKPATNGRRQGASSDAAFGERLKAAAATASGAVKPIGERVIPAGHSGPPEDAITPRSLRLLAQHKGLSDAQLGTILQTEYGKDAIRDLSREEAGQLKAFLDGLTDPSGDTAADADILE